MGYLKLGKNIQTIQKKLGKTDHYKSSDLSEPLTEYEEDGYKDYKSSDLSKPVKSSSQKKLILSDSVGNSSQEEFLSIMRQKQVFQKKTFIKFQRKSLPARVTHQVYLRDKGRCTYYDEEGRRCSSRRFLEIHHEKPVSRGGDNSVDNLRLLCSGHHKVCHLYSDRI